MQHATVSVIEQRPTLRHQAAAVASNGHVIARDTAMREILCLVRKIAGADVPVLILGEIGVGKQTIAREIHRQSPHAARPFVHVVCGSLRESDLEERLFAQSGDCSGRDEFATTRSYSNGRRAFSRFHTRRPSRFARFTHRGDGSGGPSIRF